jgi:O-succinylbenzoate synthase
MKFEQLAVRYIRPNLIKQFPLGEVKGKPRVVGPPRDMISLQARTSEGVDAWATVDTLPFPFYNPESTVEAWALMQEVGKNAVGVEMGSPEEAVDVLGPIVGHNILKAGFANLFFDAESQIKGVPLYSLVGGSKRPVEVGISIAKNATQEDIQKQIDQGFRRIKIKVGPSEDDLKKVAMIRKQNPGLMLMVDANSSFDHRDDEHMRMLREFGALDLLMIEQPLAHDDVRHHVSLQQMFDREKIPGRICLDESVETMDQMIQAVEGGIPIVNIKIARVGGLHVARQMIDYAKDNGVATWIGGMLEPTPSKAHSLAMATHPGVTLPSDISGTSAYFAEGQDPVVEPMVRDGAVINVKDEPGRGWNVDQQKLEAVTDPTKNILVFQSE